jgi:hypothetical protein
MIWHDETLAVYAEISKERLSQGGREDLLHRAYCKSDYLRADFGRVTRAATTQMMVRMKNAIAWVGCDAYGGVVVSG